MDQNSRYPIYWNLEYWFNLNQSNIYSKKLIKIVSERTKQIAETPFIYKSADFKDTRIASLGNFSILYKVTEKEIIITSFWDNRQDPNKLLRILKDKKLRCTTIAISNCFFSPTSENLCRFLVRLVLALFSANSRNYL